MATQLRICPAESPEQLAEIRALFQEYEQWLGVDLHFQQFAQELQALPGDYAPPRGRLLLGVEGAKVAGCVALRPLDPAICEMKRLFVRPAWHGRGYGRVLARAILQQARDAGYQTMRLDTLTRLAPALALYRSMGFVETAAYRDNPEPDVIYLEIDLRG